jgi:hypothetical protein
MTDIGLVMRRYESKLKMYMSHYLLQSCLGFKALNKSYVHIDFCIHF